jgi:hypothetical protein
MGSTNDTMRFEVCAAFRASDEDEWACRCGWFEEDHHHAVGELAVARAARRYRRRPPVVVPERRAS